MRTSIALQAALAAAVAHASSPAHVLNFATAGTPCATGIHMIVARGSIELPGEGRMGVVAGNVSLLIPGSTVSAVDYPATFEAYFASEAKGSEVFTTLIAEYTKQCPKTKIALLGYSQGGQALMDALCGNSEWGFTPSADLSESYESSVVAAVTFGDPSHTVGAPWNAGTSNQTGIFARSNLTACEPYSDSIRGWCDTGDIYCDNGNNTKVHGSYFKNYTMDAAEFIVKRYNLSLADASSPSSSSLALSTVTSLATATGSATSTITAAPTTTSASASASASTTGVATAGAGSIQASVTAAMGCLALLGLKMLL
ncbi:cutinase-domain-containing protein [Podospora appendiculata]|uniref:Cutinase-domain-containing protein n=1 Tax=Podospora appendiculata TaxID=314037 RepID=A0AAE1CCZ2_9PEZI|nr:cutinase-domain-containing protein [Podospora appendiculata]